MPRQNSAGKNIDTVSGMRTTGLARDVACATRAAYPRLLLGGADSLVPRADKRFVGRLHDARLLGPQRLLRLGEAGQRFGLGSRRAVVHLQKALQHRGDFVLGGKVRRQRGVEFRCGLEHAVVRRELLGERLERMRHRRDVGRRLRLHHQRVGGADFRLAQRLLVRYPDALRQRHVHVERRCVDIIPVEHELLDDL